MSKRELRMMQLAEILGQDRFINQKVANLNKKAVERYDSDLAPVPANDQQALGGIDTLVDKLNSILYNKVSLLESVPQNIDRFTDLYDYKSIISTFIEINKVDDVLTLYNSIVKQYLAPSTMTNVSKSLVRNKLASSLTNLTNVYEKLERIIINYVKQFNYLPVLTEKDDKETRIFMNIGRVISRCLSTFSVFRLIKEQIQSDNFHIVDIGDFEHEVKKLSDKNPEIRKFLEKFNKELEPRLHSKNYFHNFKVSADYRKLFKEAIDAFIDENHRRPNQGEKARIEQKLRKEFLESFSKQKLQTENAYEIELGRQMTPDERRHLFNMNRAEQPDEPVRIIQPPAYFDNAQERIREGERAERYRQYNAGLLERRDRDRARRLEEGEVDMFDPDGGFFF